MATIENIFDEVVNLNAKLDALPGLIEIHGNQVKVITLDELSESLGLIKAGEFRVGNGLVPGDSFSGMRMGYPPMYYPVSATADSDRYNLVGVDADTLQFGIRASDGAAVAGAGAVEINAYGIQFTQGQASVNSLLWLDTDIADWTPDSGPPQALVAEIFAYDALSGTSTDSVWGNVSVYAHAYVDSDLTQPTSSNYGMSQILISADANNLDHNISHSASLYLRATPDTTMGAPAAFEISLIRTLSTGTSDAEDFSMYLMRFSTDWAEPELKHGWARGDTLGSIPFDFSWYGLSTGSPYVHFDGNNDRVGIGSGSTAPAGGLHLIEGAAGNALTYNSSGDNFIIESNDHMGMQFMGPVDRDQSIWFADSDSIESGGITYSHQDDRFEIRVATAISGIWESSGLAFGNFAPDGEIHIDSAMAFTGIPTTPPSTPDTEVVKVWADTAGELRLTDSDGEDWYVTKSTSTGLDYGCRAFNLSSQDIVDNTWTAVTVDEERFDYGGLHDTATNPSRFTIPAGAAGVYSVGGHGFFTTSLNSTGGISGDRLIAVWLNGATIIGIGNGQYEVSTAMSPALYGETIYELSSGDYVEVQVYQNSGATLSLDTAANYSFEAWCIREG